MIDPRQVYLCDTGAQFTDGTTDITRTLHFGQPTADERRAYTRVLQGCARRPGGGARLGQARAPGLGTWGALSRAGTLRSRAPSSRAARPG